MSYAKNLAKNLLAKNAAMVASLVLLVLIPFANSAEKRPNVVLFLIDDLGWADLGVTGSKFYETPNLDRLAKEGAFFSDAYAANPVCSPTRASILTGKYPSRIGLTNHSGTPGSRSLGHPLRAPDVVGHMPGGDVTLAETLKKAGYATAHIGKWHLAAHHEKDKKNYPENNGFDLNIAGHKMGQPGSYYFPYESKQHPSTNVPGMEDGEEGDYLTDELTRKAIKFIESNKNEPFFLNMWYYTVHTPIHPREDKLKKYKEKAKQLGLADKKQTPVSIYQSKSRARQDDPRYAAMVESMDENVGRILDALRRLDLEENTLVIFLSDNGGLSTGISGNAPTSNFPLRGGKAWVYEGGIRVPLVIKLPGKITSGFRSAEPVVSTDIYPTVLDLVELPLRLEQHVDGVSLAGLLTGDSDRLQREAIYFHYPHYHHINTMGPAGAVRAGDFKLVEVFETGKVELYNLRDDIGETKDLSKSMPEVASKLTAMLHEWRKQSGAQMPEPNPEYSPENDYRKKGK